MPHLPVRKLVLTVAWAPQFLPLWSLSKLLSFVSFFTAPRGSKRGDGKASRLLKAQALEFVHPFCHTVDQSELHNQSKLMGWRKTHYFLMKEAGTFIAKEYGQREA